MNNTTKNILLSVLFLGVYFLFKYYLGWIPSHEGVGNNGWAMFIFIGVVLLVVVLAWLKSRKEINEKFYVNEVGIECNIYRDKISIDSGTEQG